LGDPVRTTWIKALERWNYYTEASTDCRIKDGRIMAARAASKCYPLRALSLP